MNYGCWKLCHSKETRNNKCISPAHLAIVKGLGGLIDLCERKFIAALRGVLTYFNKVNYVMMLLLIYFIRFKSKIMILMLIIIRQCLLKNLMEKILTSISSVKLIRTTVLLLLRNRRKREGPSYSGESEGQLNSVFAEKHIFLGIQYESKTISPTEVLDNGNHGIAKDTGRINWNHRISAYSDKY